MNLQQDGKTNMREILIAIDKQYVILKQLIQKSDLNILRQTLSEKFMQNIKQKDNEIALQFLGSAIVGVIIWWIEHSRPYSIDELSNELWHLLEPHIDTFL